MTDNLVLIDGHALVFRAFYGVPDLTTPKGELVNAVHGFTSMLFKAWRELKPRYVIATFDYSSKTFRKAQFPDYKGTRGPRLRAWPPVPHVFNLLELHEHPALLAGGLRGRRPARDLSLQAARSGLGRGHPDRRHGRLAARRARRRAS